LSDVEGCNSKRLLPLNFSVGRYRILISLFILYEGELVLYLSHGNSRISQPPLMKRCFAASKMKDPSIDLLPPAVEVLRTVCHEKLKKLFIILPVYNRLRLSLSEGLIVIYL